MAIDSWYAPKLRPKRDTTVPAVAGAFIDLSEVGDGKLHASPVQTCPNSNSVELITDDKTETISNEDL